MQIFEPDSGRKALFRCGRWLDRSEDDKETVRELPAASGGLYPAPLPGQCGYWRCWDRERGNRDIGTEEKER